MKKWEYFTLILDLECGDGTMLNDLGKKDAN
jgi:hypothetical protein